VECVEYVKFGFFCPEYQISTLSFKVGIIIKVKEKSREKRKLGYRE
jgi:hypothetical protein